MLNLGCGQYLRNPFFPGFWGQKWGCGFCILADYTRLYTVIADLVVTTGLATKFVCSQQSVGNISATARHRISDKLLTSSKCSQSSPTS